MKSSSESVVIGHFRNIKERLFGAKRPRNDVVTNEEGVSGFETLPVMKLLVLAYKLFSPLILCTIVVPFGITLDRGRDEKFYLILSVTQLHTESLLTGGTTVPHHDIPVPARSLQTGRHLSVLASTDSRPFSLEIFLASRSASVAIN